MKAEVWKLSEDFDGYEVSNFGNVRKARKPLAPPPVKRKKLVTYPEGVQFNIPAPKLPGVSVLGKIQLPDCKKKPKGYCYYCRKELVKGATIDHVIPKKAGGNDNSINKVLSCSSCNGMKSALMPGEFALLLKNYLSTGDCSKISKIVTLYDRWRLLLIIESAVILDSKCKQFRKKMIKPSSPPSSTPST